MIFQRVYMYWLHFIYSDMWKCPLHYVYYAYLCADCNLYLFHRKRFVNVIIGVSNFQKKGIYTKQYLNKWTNPFLLLYLYTKKKKKNHRSTVCGFWNHYVNLTVQASKLISILKYSVHTNAHAFDNGNTQMADSNSIIYGKRIVNVIFVV